MMTNKLKEFVVKDLLMMEHQEEVHEDDDLLLLGLNSLRIMRLVNFIEDQFNLTIPPQDVIPAQLKSLSRIEQLLARLINESSQHQ